MDDQPSSFPSREAQIEHESAQWLARRDRGLTAREQDDFFSWLASDPRHGEQLAQHQETVRSLKMLAQWRPEHGTQPNPDLLAAPQPPVIARSERDAAIDPKKPVIARSQLGGDEATHLKFPPESDIVIARSPLGADAATHPNKKSIIRWALPLTLATAAGLALALWWPSREIPALQPPPAPEIASTPLITRKILEDGSAIDLNHGAVVEVSYTPAQRAVRLVRGEATFTVAKNADRPFIVDAAGVSVRAVGTAFNVNLQAKTVEVLVTEGRVQVSQPAAVAVAAAATAKTPTPTPAPLIPLLEAGQRATISLVPATPKIESVPTQEMARELAWQPRQLEFNDTPLAQVVAEFNGNNRVKMVVDDPVLASVPIGASLRSDNVEGFVRLLEASFGVKADRRPDGVIVLRRQ